MAKRTKIVGKTLAEIFRSMKDMYQGESEVVGGEFADWLVKNKEVIAKQIPTWQFMIAVQKFREWDQEEEDDVVYAEIDVVSIDGIEVNDFSDYTFEDGTIVPPGVRIGTERFNEHDILTIFLDDGIKEVSLEKIVYPTSEIKNFMKDENEIW